MSSEDENLLVESSPEQGPRKTVPRGSFRKQVKVSIDGFDEDLMGDDEDRFNLAQMTQLEREKILGERQRKRDELKRKKEVLEALDRKRGHERFGNEVRFR